MPHKLKGIKRGPIRKTNIVPPLPPCRTLEIPGTPEKIEVMRRRVENGYQPHHPDDVGRKGDE